MNSHVYVRVMMRDLFLFSSRSSNSAGLSAPPLTALITPEPVRHSRIPDLPLDNSLLFEFLLFLYLLVALFVQYINIYRTVWWYPYSQPAASTSLVSPHTNSNTITLLRLGATASQPKGRSYIFFFFS